MNTEPVGLETFFNTYVQTALDDTRDEDRDDDKTLSHSYSSRDIAPEALSVMRADCEKFLTEQGELVEEENFIGASRRSALEMAAYHFWHTRNGSGVGFWDGDWKDEVSEKLSDAAHAFGACSL